MNEFPSVRRRILGSGRGLGSLLMVAFFAVTPLCSATAEEGGPAPVESSPDPQAAETGPAAPEAAGSPAAESQPAESAPQPAETQAVPKPAGIEGESRAPEASAPRPAAPGPEVKGPVSTAVVINLIRLLVQEGVLSQAKAAALIRQAQDEAAAAARAQAAGVAPAAGAPENMAPTGTAAPPAESAAAAQTGESTAAAAGAEAAAPAAGAAPEGASAASELPKPPPPPVHVQYVPEIVKREIEEQVKDKVMAQAKAENWAAPNALPEWTKRIKINGDFRLRYEWDLFDKRNSNLFPDFQALNSGKPFDLQDKADHPIPLLNTTDDRERLRIRARLGLTADITDDVSVGLRLATGNTTNPVSTNQTLGSTLANDNFALDRAYIRYQPTPWLTLFGGRFENPWFYTDLVWDPDLNFDGVAAQYAPHPNGKVSPFVTVGAFSVENTLFNFPAGGIGEDLHKVGSRDKWLYGAQAGVSVQPRPEYGFKAGVAYYYYENVQGMVSSPCFANTADIPCDTDNTRPQFIQFGNTLYAIRNLTTLPDHEFQYYGLASPFRELNATFQFDFAKYDPLHIVFDADFVTNLAFDKNSIAAKFPVNNLAGTLTGGPGPWEGGGNGYQASLTVGHPHIVNLWDWNVYAAYKYIESDAVLDAFTDSDFHLGGTNAKGYIFGGSLGIGHNIDLTARGLSASEVSGFPYTVDVIQLDLNARF
jgi:hypothetical protein